jgi:hypothetical protein
VDLPLDKITLRSDARAINFDTVSGLAESIATVGLINPIRVRVSGDGWEVVAGAHRLEACRSLGLAEIECDVVEDDDLHAELAMIDENLCRAELSPSDRARQTARRKAIYEAIHKEAAHGGNSGGPSGQFVHTDVDSFAANTAKAIGKDERSVRRDAERGQKILPEVLDMIQGTQLDTATFLDKLKSLPGSEQFTATKRALAVLREHERNRERDNASSANKTKLDADIRQRADRANAEILAEYLPAEIWDHFKANAAVGSYKGTMIEFANIVGASVMDRSAG